MVQVRVATKGMDLDKFAKDLKRNVEDFKQDVLLGMADRIASTSPVDTGTYARNHEVALRSGSFQSNVVIPKGAPKADAGAAREFGRAGMIGDIMAMDMTSSNFVFRNATTHAPFVERRDKVYAMARVETGRIIKEALARASAKNAGAI